MTAQEPQSEPACKQTVDAALELLEKQAPGAPFLALGQTVFWDEPMKAGIVIASNRKGYDRKLVAGVHDTDYFAKLPSGRRQPGKFRALPHNDTTTKGLWSAAAEFSALFGSETVVGRESLVKAGLRVDKLLRSRPTLLDDATEAFRWRGVVSLDEHAPITAELPIGQVFDELFATLKWALETSLESIAGESRAEAQGFVDEILDLVCDHRDKLPTGSLSDLYRGLLAEFYRLCSDSNVDVEVTATTELLRFNTETAHLPRFELLNMFVDPATRPASVAAYDEAVQGSGLYGLSRFGTGAIPFDLVIPGRGRGTILLGNRGIVATTPDPSFVSLKRPVQSAVELAQVVEAKFGKDCTLVGKAVTLIGMLAREFVFVFHEGASNYVRHSRKLHQALAAQGAELKMNPILRVKYDAWTAMRVSCAWLKLPTELQRPFGAEEVCAPNFANRWAHVAQDQEVLLAELGAQRRPVDLVRFLDKTIGGSWNELADEYVALHGRMESLQAQLTQLRAQRSALYDRKRALRASRVAAELAKGEHFRAAIFEKRPPEGDRKKRDDLAAAVDRVIAEQGEVDQALREAYGAQQEIVADPEIQNVHERRRDIEMEAELKRLTLIRQATVASLGLRRANHRPSAWWFRLVSSDGLWFRETINSAEAYLEPLN